MSVDEPSPEEFAARARAWLAKNMPHPTPGGDRGFRSDEAELAAVQHQRQLQRTLYDGGYAGICFPREYGGQGLTTAHQQAFNVACVGYDMPDLINMPTLVPCAAILLEFGTEEQKLRHIPAMLRGDELWMQFLSEPSGGSDVAGALTTAVRDGDEWIVNGSKIWTTGAWWSDYGLCLLRTNWEVPKHSGLSVFILPIKHPDVEVQRIEMINGSKEFCQEFMTDLRVPDSDRVGEVDDGWTVGRRWMFHERNAMGGGSPYVSAPAPSQNTGGNDADNLIGLARNTGQLDDPRVRDLIGEVRVLQRARTELTRRIGEGMTAGVFTDASAAIPRLMSAVVAQRTTTVRLDIAGARAAAWTDDEPGAGAGNMFLMRQTSSIAGGTTEMARNNISERVLGMPRERTLDKDVPFRDVPKGPPAKSS
ncbi:MAG TPA: acyl-CoA dehydrogenase family protein [Acidimicrobiales bacterium]|nr:acyl-CoA dehydrogenase family protein [Acidimicrobiales bacterium]